MKIIQEIEDNIHDELKSGKKYIKCALKYKDENPKLGDMYYQLSIDTMLSVDRLHKMVVAIIEEYRLKNGEPPKEMLAVYNYLHDKEIEKSKTIKNMQSMYK